MDGRQPTDGQKTFLHCIVDKAITTYCHVALASLIISILSAGVSLNEAPPELQQLALNFLATFLVVILQNTTVVHLHAPREFFPF